MRTKAVKPKAAAPSTSASPEIAKSPAKPAIPHPTGKLGTIMDRVSSKTGATAEELVAATGWQRHSVLGALSRLKARGFPIRLERQDSRKVYRLRAAEE